MTANSLNLWDIYSNSVDTEWKHRRVPLYRHWSAKPLIFIGPAIKN